MEFTRLSKNVILALRTNSNSLTSLSLNSLIFQCLNVLIHEEQFFVYTSANKDFPLKRFTYR